MNTALSSLSRVARLIEYMNPPDPYTKIRVKKKSESLLMRLLGKLLFFNKKFMDYYYTTIGDTIYLPNYNRDGDDPSSLAIFAHEIDHIYRSHTWSITYPLLYLFPQILVILAPVGFFLLPGAAAWASLGFLLAAAPWPAPGRAYIERWGYLMNIAYEDWVQGHVSRSTLDHALDQFSGPSYYWMSWRRKKVEAWFAQKLGEIRQGKHTTTLSLFYEFLKQEKLLKSQKGALE